MRGALLGWLTLLGCSGAAEGERAAGKGTDLRLTYRSPIDDTDQPYRIYIPGAYDGRTPLPLVVALHGTSGNESTLFDTYGNGEIKRVAERRGAIVLSPFGRGVTEYRGIGENDVLSALADARRRYRVDPDRIYATGHSMGGTGAAYLAFRHPGLFAAVAPLAAATSFPWLVGNARHIPFWWILGGKDEPFYLTGVKLGAERMIALGLPAKIDVLPGRGHGDWVPEYFDPVFEWLLRHRRLARPREYEYSTESPLHGAAYSTAIDRLAKPGRVGTLSVRIEKEGIVSVRPANVAAFAVLPDPELLDLAGPVRVLVEGVEAWSGRVTDRQEVRLTRRENGWTATVGERRGPVGWRSSPVAVADQAVTMEGTEAPLGNWIADAMRAAAGADLALYNRRHYRGLPLRKGPVDMVDLIQASRPFDQYLVVAELTGADVLEILEDNIREPARSITEDRLVQVSGLRYAFDRARPKGSRIVSSDLDARRVYTVALEGQVPERETIFLAGRFGKLPVRMTDVPFVASLYAHAAATGKIGADREGRVRDVKE
ncbi:MAG TPA: 5'-nucleotidase C-terminal domain-containing protein [Planctomycetota bacterium]|nr:5'-nucleotidase C-terminal domain-containing protein [Planctomycetota bacterium]